MAQVLLDNVSKLYPGGVRAVDGVSLDIRDREFVVLVGPSGCGKSTTLRMIAGLEEISSGTIRIGDRVVNDLPPRDRDIAMVFQNYALYPHMSVYRNMAFALELRMMPGLLGRVFNRAKAKAVRAEIDRRVFHAADILEIRHLLDRKPRELSGGQRQRVAVGRAIVREPAAFLFDEPLSNLDAKLRVTTRAELKRLHQRIKTTTIYVTHDQEEAMTLGDRIVVMKDGQIQQADTPLVTYNRPVNRFVAGFIGMPPMNFFDGVLKADGEQLVFEENCGDSAARATDQLTLSGIGFRLPLPSKLGPRAAPLGHWVGRRVVLGIRPEHLHLRSNEDVTRQDRALSVPLQMTITVVEPLGSDMDVYMKTALHDQVVARVEARMGLEVGEQVTIYADPTKAHLFEPGEAGMNLSLESQSPAATEPTHVLS